MWTCKPIQPVKKSNIAPGNGRCLKSFMISKLVPWALTPVFMLTELCIFVSLSQSDPLSKSTIYKSPKTAQWIKTTHRHCACHTVCSLASPLKWHFPALAGANSTSADWSSEVEFSPATSLGHPDVLSYISVRWRPCIMKICGNTKVIIPQIMMVLHCGNIAPSMLCTVKQPTLSHHIWSVACCDLHTRRLF